MFDAVGGRAALGISAARLHEAMRAGERRFRAAFEHAPIGIGIFRADPAGLVRYIEVNPALCLIAGYPRKELLSRPAPHFTHPDDREAERQRLEWLLEGRIEEVSGEKRLVRPDGDARWVQVRSAPLGDGTFVQQLQDVTEHRRFQRELEHLASHDTLTGLLNRRRFEEALEQALANVRRHGDEAAVLTLDIDNFKHVNDTYGHPAGDEVLRAIAEALQGRTRATDRVARLGGDEFGVILARTDSDGARAVAEELLEAVRSAGVAIGDRRIRVTASAGLRSLDSEERAGAGDLLSEADMAMYDAKERGRDRLSIIRSGDQQPERVRARMLWSERIRDALENEGGFVLFEQPILRLATGEVDRSELLIRMVGDSGEPIAPGHFLPVAERYGQMQAIDRWVVHSAIDLVAERRDAAAEMKVEVNLSGESMTDAAFVDYIIAEIRNARIDPRCLIFEVTETVAISNLDRARQLARRLSNLGCGFALDDFGAGFASFAYLKHLPLDVIKIDGEFIRHLPRSQHDQVTVRAIVDIARGLGKETVAEFVEDQETLEALKRLGVDRAQGYHVGRPRPASVHPVFQSL
jgi:diguanylate cyclase (GGDEF)-like protein/PAS domain S-box-containing protein